MNKTVCRILLAVTMLIAGCGARIGDHMAAATISKDGFVRNADTIRRLAGQKVKLRGYWDQGNPYGDEGAKQILGERRSVKGRMRAPSASA